MLDVKFNYYFLYILRIIGIEVDISSNVWSIKGIEVDISNNVW